LLRRPRAFQPREHRLDEAGPVVSDQQKAELRKRDSDLDRRFESSSGKRRLRSRLEGHSRCPDQATAARPCRHETCSFEMDLPSLHDRERKGIMTFNILFKF